MNRTNASVISALFLIAAMQFRTPTPVENGGSEQLRSDASDSSKPSETDGTSESPARYAGGPWSAVCGYLGHRRAFEENVADAKDQARARSPNLNPSDQDSTSSANTASGEERFKNCLARDGDAHIFRTLIVTVPDPINTQLGLEYDRAMESLERAGSEASYSLSRYWVPWDEIYKLPQTDLKKRNIAEDERRRREREPGVLVFRQAPPRDPPQLSDPREVLLIFLVGEGPSAGINKTAFKRAVLYSQLLQKAPSVSRTAGSCNENTINDTDLIISGPGFSGSFDSMKVALSSLARERQLPSCVHISSTASNTAERQQFRQDVSSGSINESSKVFFTVVTNDDTTRRCAMKRFFWDKYGYKPSQVLFLNESASGFRPPPPPPKPNRKAKQSPSPSPANTPATTIETRKRDSGCGEDHMTLFFPRGIAPLRNAYQSAQEAIARLSTQPMSALLSLPLSYRESGPREHDTLPPMSRDQTAVSQDAVLRQISHTIRKHSIKVAVVVATDNLDTLFLLHYLRMSNPDLLLAIPNADLMYIRAGDPVDYVGTLVFTDRPLFTTDVAQVRFPSSTALGTYLSVLTLLDREDSKDNRPLDLWAGVIGHDGFWPMNTVSPFGDAQTGPALGRMSVKVKSVLAYKPLPPPTFWGVLSALICFLAILHCGLCVVGSWHHSANGNSSGIRGNLNRFMDRLHDRWFMDCYIVNPAATMEPDVRDLPAGPTTTGESAQPERALYLFVETIFALLAQLIVLLPTWSLVWFARHKQPTSSLHFFLLVLSSVCIAFTLVVAGLLLTRLFGSIQVESTERGRSDAEARSKTLARSCILLFAGGVFFIVSGLWAWLCFNQSGEYLSQRTVFLLSGLSPALPLLLLAGGIYHWAWMNCRRIAYFETRRPDLPKLCSRNNSGFDFGKVSNEFESILGRKFVPYSRWLLVALLLLAAITWRAGLFPRGLDGWSFDIALNLLLAILWMMVIFAWLRFIETWFCFRKLLRALEQSPLRFAFSRLPETFSWSPVWRIGGAKRSFLIQTRSVEYMNCAGRDAKPYAQRVFLPIFGAHKVARSDGSQRDVRALMGVVLKREQEGLRLLAAQMRQLRQDFEAVANYWCQDLSIWLEKGGADDSDKASRRADVPSFESIKHSQLRLLKGEFIALRFVAFIRYIGLQMRNQLLFISVGFVLALCALKSYPFQQRQTISWILIGLFAILTIGIVVVFAEMDKDAILSRISNTEAGKLDWQFLVRIVGFGALPLVTILASQVPSISNLLFSWIRPGLEALK